MADLDRDISEIAIESFLQLQRERLELMFNRDRARFAECVVAALLGTGTQVARNPNAAWDVSLKLPALDQPIRIEVKCSGAYLPAQVASRPSYRARPKWELPADKTGIEDVTFRKLGVGRHWDVIVLARHSGDSINDGWFFWVLSSHQVPATRKPVRVGEDRVGALGATRSEPSQLSSTVIAGMSAPEAV